MLREKKREILIIGGGMAGLSLALQLSKRGKTDFLLVEEREFLGGMLGLSILPKDNKSLWCEVTTKMEEDFVSSALPSSLKTRAMKIDFEKKRVLLISPTTGPLWLAVKHLVLASGARQKTWANFHRAFPKGVFWATGVLEQIHHRGLFPGKKNIIFGSSNTALELAQRMVSKGKQVMAIIEPGPFIQADSQMLSPLLNLIPLYLNHQIIQLSGEKKLQGLRLRPPQGPSFSLACDTLVLAPGREPRDELTRLSPLKRDSRTGGLIVDGHLRTSLEWIWALGDSLYPYPTVESLEEDSVTLALALALSKPAPPVYFPLLPGPYIEKVIPQRWAPQQMAGLKIQVYPQQVEEGVFLEVSTKDGEIIYRKYQKKLSSSRGTVVHLPSSPSEIETPTELIVSLWK